MSYIHFLAQERNYRAFAMTRLDYAT